MKLAKRLFNSLPLSVKTHFFRKFFKFSKDYYDPKYKVELATTIADLQSAFELVYEQYQKIGITDPCNQAIRCNLYSFLPFTSVIVARYEEEIIGTVSLIRDSEYGLPSDVLYKQENDELRSGGKILVEVGCLSVAKNHQIKNHNASLLLMKFLDKFTKEHMQGDYLVCTIHPRADFFYSGLFGFKQNGRIFRYESLKKALAIHMSMPTGSQHQSVMIRNFEAINPTNNFPKRHYHEEDARLKYPTKKPGQVIYPSMNQNKLNYFLQALGAHELIKSSERKIIGQVYRDFISPQFSQFLLNTSLQSEPTLVDSRFDNRKKAERDFRLPSKMTALLRVKDEAEFANIHNISIGGVFVKTLDGTFLFSHKLQVGDAVDLVFCSKEGSLTVSGFIQWINTNQKERLPVGIGLNFKGNQSVIAKLISEHMDMPMLIDQKIRESA